MMIGGVSIGAAGVKLGAAGGLTAGVVTIGGAITGKASFVDRAGIRDSSGAPTGTARLSVLGATGIGACAVGTSAAPHIPQKRLPSEFSFPHRPQRTYPPKLTP